MAKKNWYKGLTATAVAIAMAGVASMIPAFAEEEPTYEPEKNESQSSTESTLDTTSKETIVKQDENGQTVTETTTTETKEEKDPDFTEGSTTVSTYMFDSEGKLIERETTTSTSSGTSEVEKSETGTVTGETTEESEPEPIPAEDLDISPEGWEDREAGSEYEVGDTTYVIESNTVNTTADGITVRTVVMDYTTEKDTDITKDELSKALGKELTQNEDGSYTYTNEDGKPVTVTVTRDDSTEKNKVTVTLSLVQITETQEDEAEIGQNKITNIEDGNKDNDTLSVKEVLGFIDSDGVEVTYNDEGRVSKVVKDGKTYTFSYTDSEDYEEVDISTLSGKKIAALLGNGYTVDQDGNVLDPDGHVLTFEEKQAILRNVTIKVETSRAEASTEMVNYEGTQESAKDEVVAAAKKDALIKAASKEGITLTTDDIDLSKLDENGVWKYENTVDGITYTYSFKLGTTGFEAVPDEWSAEKIEEVEKKEGVLIDSGATVKVWGYVSVTGNEKVWTTTETESGETIPFYENGQLNLDQEGVEIVKNDPGKEVIFTYEGSTYTLTYSDLGEEDLLKLKEKYGEDAIDFNTESLQKVTYTVMKPESVEDASVYTRLFSDVQIVMKTVDGVNKFYYINGTLETELTPVEGKDGVYTDADGKTYTVKGSTTLTDDQIQTLLEQKFTNVTVKDGVATYVQNGVTYTVKYGNPILLDVGIEEKQASGAFTTEAEFVTWVRGEIAKAKTGQYGLSIGGTDLLEKEYTDAELAALASTVVNYHELTEEQLTTLLVNMKTEAGDTDKYTSVDTDGDGINDKAFDHIDLNSGSTLTIGDETENCILLRDGLTFKVSTDAKTIVTGQVQENADGTTTTITDLSETFKDSISYDQGGAHYEYQHKDSQSNLPAENAYYCVTGTVVYGDYIGCNSSDEANAYAKDIEGAYVVKVSGEYRVYTQSAQLTAYGYMTHASNNCKNGKFEPEYYKRSRQWGNFPGYDLEIADLTMTEEGKVVAHGKDVKTYSADLVKVSKLTGTALSVIKTTHQEDKITDEGSGILGEYTVSHKTEKTYDETDDVKGEAESSYSYYFAKNIIKETGTASGQDYAGVINYSYSYVTEPVLERAEVQTETTRTLDADVKQEWKDTVYTYTTVETVKDTVVVSPTPNPEPTPRPTPDPVPDPEPTPDPIPETETEPTPEPSIPDDVISIIAETEEEVSPIVSVPKTGTAEKTSAAAAFAAALGGIAFALSRKRKHR